MFLEAFTHARLSPTDQQRVADKIEKLFTNNVMVSYTDFRLFMPLAAKVAFWAVAMDSLSIPPAVDGESWRLPRRSWWFSRLGVINKLLLDFRPFNSITNQVKSDLAAKGVNVEPLGL